MISTGIEPISGIIGISTTEYENRRKGFEAYKDTLTKEPSGDVKKEYCIVCFQKSDWDFVHAELIKDGSLEDNIPTDKCDCINDCLQSDVRGIYLLTDTEATELRANTKVECVNINVAAYPGTYKQNPDDLLDNYRYESTVKIQQDSTNFGSTPPGIIMGPTISPLPGEDDLNSSTSQVHRHSTKNNPWVTLGDPEDVINSRISQYGTGVDVDVIVADTDMWFGHIEFQDPAAITNIKDALSNPTKTVAPIDFIPGNVLRSGFSASSTSGTCGLLDLVLDSPYYIDSAWFEADVASRLMERWDGTMVPVESVAREWWSDASKRSAAFASAGTVTIPSAYTRADNNGSNTAYNRSYYDFWSGDTIRNTHGTMCASLAYGRTFGWAYNANKWHITVMGATDVEYEVAFDVQKIFHENKPTNSKYGTKDPTISSNSWAFRHSYDTSGGYYYYRQGTTGSGGAEYTSWNLTGGSSGSPGGVAPRFMTNFYQTRIRMEPQSGSALTAGNELVASGVIFCCSAGNTRQKLVDGSHADFNNYFSTSNSTALSSSTFTSSGITWAKTINRTGFPGAIGKTGSGASARYSTIQVGALHHTLLSGKGHKVYYSNMGQAVDCYAVADKTMCAATESPVGASVYYTEARYDMYYTYNSSQSLVSRISTTMNGTSAACPVAAGLIATKLQYNRDWTFTDVKTWLTSTVGQQDVADFYVGTEATSVNDTNWTDTSNLQGGAPIVPYDTPVSEPTGFIIKDKTVTGALPSTSNNGTDYMPLQFYLDSDIMNEYPADIGTSAADSYNTLSAASISPPYSSKYTGKHVDIVTMEGGYGITATNQYPGVENTHPEFDDPDNTGTTRCIPMDWPGLSMDTNNQVTNSSDGMFTKHALGVLSVAGGVNCGYAKKASLRTMYMIEGSTTCMNALVSWHNSKSNNPITGIKNPTILIGEFQWLKDIEYAFKVDDIQSVTDPTGGTTTRPGSGWGSDLTPFTSRNIIPYKLKDPTDASWHWVIPIPEQNQYTSLKTAMDAAWDAGIVLIMSAGNNGGTYVKDSDSRWSGTYISFTGSYDQYNIGRDSDSKLVISKTSTTITNWYPFRAYGPTGHDKSIDVAAGQNSQGFPCLDMYSNRGPGIDVVGMGANTWSADPDYTYADGNQWGMFSGTSCAAPTVVGKAACMMEEYYTLYGSWPTANQVKSMVTSEAKSVVIDVDTTTWDNVPIANDTNINVTNSTTGTALVELKDGISANGELKFAELAGTTSKRGFWNAKGYNRSQTLGKRPSTSTNGVKYPRPYNLGQGGSLSGQ